MERFVEPFVEKGLPFHVAIHAPGEKNDARNFHAHIVYSERPARQMPHPETGRSVWDFTVTRAYKTSSRNTKYTYPYRQKRDRDIKEWDAIAKLRKDYACIVTEVMATIDPTVKFDPRSYKDMGLTTTPLATVHRALHDRMRDGALILMDENWSKRMVAAEVDAAAQRKDPHVMRLLELTTQLEGLRDAWPELGAVNSRLDAKSRISGLAGFTKRIFRRTIDDRIRLEAEVVKERVIANAEIEVCRKVLKASRPLKEGTVTVHRKAARTPEEQAELDLIHAAAAEELAATQGRLKNAEAEAKRRLKANAKTFQDAGHGRMTAGPSRPVQVDKPRQRAPQVGVGASAQAPTAPEVAAKAKTRAGPTAPTFVPSLPEEAERAERKRKRRHAEAARRMARGADHVGSRTERGGTTAPPAKAAEAAQQSEAELAAKAKPNPQMAQGAAPAPYEESEADRKLARERAIAQARADLLAMINAQMSAMYDPELRGKEFAASLKEQLDLYYPERNGVHGPDANELALQTEAFARSENAPQANHPTKTAEAAQAAVQQEPIHAPVPASPAPARQAEPTRAPAPAQAAPKPAAPLDLTGLPRPVPRNSKPIRIREGAHRPMFETPPARPPAIVRNVGLEPPRPASHATSAAASEAAPAAAPQAMPASPARSAAPQPAAPSQQRRTAPQLRILEEYGVLELLDPTRRPSQPTYRDPQPSPHAAAHAPNEPRPAVEMAARSAPHSRTKVDPPRTDRQAKGPADDTAPPSLAHEVTGKATAPATSVRAEQTAEADVAAAAKAEANRKKKRRKAIISHRPTRGGYGER